MYSMPTISSGKISKNEYHKREEILPSDQSRMKEKASFIYSLLGKALEKKRKTMRDKEKNNFKL